MNEAPLTDEEFADLAERAHQILSLADTLGWDLFKDRAYVEIQKHQRDILNGRLSESEYHRVCGWVAGAEAVLALPQQVRLELERAAAERAVQVADEAEAVA